MKKVIFAGSLLLLLGTSLVIDSSSVSATTNDSKAVKTGAVPSYGLIENYGAPAVNIWNKFYNPNYRP